MTHSLRKFSTSLGPVFVYFFLALVPALLAPGLSSRNAFACDDKECAHHKGHGKSHKDHDGESCDCSCGKDSKDGKAEKTEHSCGKDECKDHKCDGKECCAKGGHHSGAEHEHEHGKKPDPAAKAPKPEAT